MTTSSQTYNSGSNKLSVALLNIDGLRNKTEDIRHIISRDKVHVFALCETKLDASVADSKVYIPGFRMWRKDRDCYGGGVALYVQDHIEAKLRSDLMNPEVEIIWVQMEIPDSRPVLLGICYRPPGNDVKYLFGIYENVSLVSQERWEKHILLMGDFNIDWKKKNSLLKNMALFVLPNWGLKQIVDVPTRKTLKLATCIDHIYTNDQNLCSKPESRITICSDHNLVTFKVKRNIPEKTIWHRSSKPSKRNNYIKDVKKARWTKVYKRPDPLSTFTKIFRSLAKEHSTLKIRNIYDLLKVNTELNRKKQKIRLQQQVKDAKDDPEKLFRIFKDCLGENLPLYVINITQDRDQTNSETEGFIPDGHYVQTSLKTRSSFSFQKTDAELVKRFLLSFCGNMTRGIDQTEAELLRLAADDISGPICHILNKYIESEEFPSKLKPPQPIPGSGPTFFRENRRNHGVHTALGWIFDAILYCQTSRHFTVNNPTKRDDEIKRIEKDWLTATGSGKTVKVVFLDFSSLFHSIRHDLLVNELRSYGFSDSALALIKSFLSYHSDSCGLPQRSSLARFLCSVFLNDLRSILKESSFALSENHLMIYYTEKDHWRFEAGNRSLLHWKKKKNICWNKTETEATKENTRYIFHLLKSVLHCKKLKLNWVQGLKLIMQHYGPFWENKYHQIFKKLQSNFSKKCLYDVPQEIRKTVIDSLVLFQLKSKTLP